MWTRIALAPALLGGAFLSTTFQESAWAAPQETPAQPADALDQQTKDLEALKRYSRITPVVEVYRTVSPSVVFIQTKPASRVRSVLGNRSPIPNSGGSGTGVVIQEDGYLVTNFHVVRDADPAQIQVSFEDDPTPYRAELLSYRELEDLALLRIIGPMRGAKQINIPAGQQGKLKRDGTLEGPRTKFPTVRMGTSADLMPGERVIAIGNPHGQTHTVTEGIISGLHRDVQVGGRYGQIFPNLIQTDASINLGNSGGPLLNVHGEMIGINTVMNTAAENIGYAIPVDRVREVLSQHLYPNAQTAWTGMEIHLAPDPQVTKVWPGSPAALAGICQGDRVLRIGGKEVLDEASLLNANMHVTPYLNTEFLVETGAGDRIAKQLTPWDRKQGVLYEVLGCTTDEVSDGRRMLVLVDQVRPDGPAEELGLTAGDWLFGAKFNLSPRDERTMRIDGRDSLLRLAGALPSGTGIEMDIYRDLNDDQVFTRDEIHRGTLNLE